MDNKNLDFNINNYVRDDAQPLLKQLYDANPDLYNQLANLSKTSPDLLIKDLKNMGLHKDQLNKVNLKVALDNLLLGSKTNLESSDNTQSSNKKVVILDDVKLPGQNQSGVTPMPSNKIHSNAPMPALNGPMMAPPSGPMMAPPSGPSDKKFVGSMLIPTENPNAASKSVPKSQVVSTFVRPETKKKLEEEEEEEEKEASNNMCYKSCKYLSNRLDITSYILMAIILILIIYLLYKKRNNTVISNE